VIGESSRGAAGGGSTSGLRRSNGRGCAVPLTIRDHVRVLGVLPFQPGNGSCGVAISTGRTGTRGKERAKGILTVTVVNVTVSMLCPGPRRDRVGVSFAEVGVVCVVRSGTGEDKERK
jgi:hypothetical protein